MTTTRARRRPLEAAQLAQAAGMIRVLGHPVRLRIAEALEGGERCVSELQAALGGTAQAVVSQQLARMKAAGIVSCRRDGANVRYALADQRAMRVLDCLRDCGPPSTTPSKRRS